MGQVTERMVELADLIVAESEATKTWSISNGVCEGKGLWIVPPGDGELYPGGGVVRCEMKAGDEFPPHKQEHCTEWLTVLGGLAEVPTFSEDGSEIVKSVILGPGEAIRIEPGQIHQCRAICDTQILGVTVPRDRGYPDADADTV